MHRQPGKSNDNSSSKRGIYLVHGVPMEMIPEEITYRDPADPDTQLHTTALRMPSVRRHVPRLMNPRIVTWRRNGKKRGVSLQRMNVTTAVHDGNVHLYHFTTVPYLDRILREGLSIGDVMTSLYGGFNNAVWLTEQAAPEAQRWRRATRPTRIAWQRIGSA